MEEISMESFIQVMALLKDMLQEDIAVAVVDTTNFLYYRPGNTIDFKIKVGSKMSTDEPLYKTIKNGKAYSTFVPKEILGVPFKSITYPVKDLYGCVIGAVAIGRSLDNQYRVEAAVDNVFSSLEETNASIQDICDGSQKLLNLIEIIVESTKQTEQSIKQSNEIIGMIQNMASQSNLLGLNASIEAARSGEHGRGFSVVANEIRKLAQLSSESSQKVSKTLLEINKSIENVLMVVNQAQLVSKGQADATQEITAALEEITSSSQTLVELAKIN